VLLTRDLLFAGWLVIPAIVGLTIAALLDKGARGSAWPEVAALLVLACGGYPTMRFQRLELPRSRTVKLDEPAAPELYALVRELAAQLGVPAPNSIELSPDCDAWLEPRTTGAALVIGSPFLWWLRVTEIRGLLAPVIAGAAQQRTPRVRAARRFVLRLDVLCDRLAGRTGESLVRRLAAAPRAHARAMERAVAADAAELSAVVDPAGRIVAHEQVALIVTAWDRVLTRLATPAWDRDCAPVALGAALVAALTELGSRDRLSHELATRLAERPACDLLEEPGRYDALVSKLAASVFAGRSPRRHVEWDDYVPAVVEPGRRALAATAGGIPTVAPLVSALTSGERRCAPQRAGADRHIATRAGARFLDSLAGVAPLVDADIDPDEAATFDAMSLVDLATNGSSELAGTDAAVMTDVGLSDMTMTSNQLVGDGLLEATPPYGEAQPRDIQRSGPDERADIHSLGILNAYDMALDAAAAVVECVAVDRGVARWRLDWLDGVVLRHSGGGVLPVSDLVARALATGDLSPLQNVLT
jgi:hypothetical protein